MKSIKASMVLIFSIIVIIGCGSLAVVSHVNGENALVTSVKND